MFRSWSTGPVTMQFKGTINLHVASSAKKPFNILSVAQMSTNMPPPPVPLGVKLSTVQNDIISLAPPGAPLGVNMNSFSEKFPYEIAVLGATGNIGSITVRNLLKQGLSPNKLLLNNSSGKIFEFEEYSIGMTKMEEAVRAAKLVILAIKPQIWDRLEIPFQPQQFVITPMAGKTVRQIKEAAEKQGAPDVVVARIMPTTPSRIHLGLTGVLRDNLTAEQFELVKGLYCSSGLVIEVHKEDDLNKITSAASSIAFYFYIIELLEKIAIEMNLEPSQAITQILAGCTEALALAEREPFLISKSYQPYLESAIQNALSHSYLKALELSGVSPNRIRQTQIADQQERLVSDLQKQFQSMPLLHPSGLNLSLSEVSHVATFAFMKAMQVFFTTNDFTSEEGIDIALQTLRGAYGLMTESNAESIAKLGDNVRSKGGTTQAGVQSLGMHFKDNVRQVIITPEVRDAQGRTYASLFTILRSLFF